MLKTGQQFTGTIQYVDAYGNGVIRYKNDTVFVRNILPKEDVHVKVLKRIQQGYVATIMEIKKASPLRVLPACAIYERCGSCHLMHMQLKAQAAYKKERIEALCKKEKLKLQVCDVLTMENPYHYRNKMIIGFTKGKQKEIQAGFYEEFTHQIIPYKTCLLHPTICDAIIASILKLLNKFRIEIYNEDRRSGLLRHVLIRYGEMTGQIMVVLVLNSNVFPARKNFVQALLKLHPEITTIVQNVNTRKTSVVLGNDERILYGPGYIEDTLCGNCYRISAKSFYQINHSQTEVLYQRAVQMLDIKGNEHVLDAYCGIGTIGMYTARFVKDVIGVEINKDAIQDAQTNAKINQVKNIRFLCGDAGEYMRKLAAQRKSLDIVIIDPPRSGSSETFIKSVAALHVKQVLYISCNPQTQLRDVKMFQRYGYQSSGIVQPVDLFPFTNHVETIMLLQLSNEQKKKQMRS